MASTATATAQPIVAAAPPSSPPPDLTPALLSASSSDTDRPHQLLALSVDQTKSPNNEGESSGPDKPIARIKRAPYYVADVQKDEDKSFKCSICTKPFKTTRQVILTNLSHLQAQPFVIDYLCCCYDSKRLRHTSGFIILRNHSLVRFATRLFVTVETAPHICVLILAKNRE